jgi:hypothetical protein
LENVQITSNALIGHVDEYPACLTRQAFPGLGGQPNRQSQVS